MRLTTAKRGARLAAALVAGLAMAATGAAAQRLGEAPDSAQWTPPPGSWSLAFELPSGGGGAIGVWRQTGSATAIGLTLDGAFIKEEDSFSGEDRRALQLAVGPALRHFWWTDAPVVPFLHAGLTGLYTIQGTSSTDTRWSYAGALDLGVGAEWLPLERIGVSGYAGVQGTYRISDGDAAGVRRTDAFGVDLFNSRLTLHLYF